MFAKRAHHTFKVGNDVINGNSGLNWILEIADVDFTLTDSQPIGRGNDTGAVT